MPDEAIGEPAEEQIAGDQRARDERERLRCRGAIVARDVAQPGRDPQREERHHRALVRADRERHAPERAVARDAREAAQSFAQAGGLAGGRMLGHDEHQHGAQRERRHAERGEDLAPAEIAQRDLDAAPKR